MFSTRASRSARPIRTPRAPRISRNGGPEASRGHDRIGSDRIRLAIRSPPPPTPRDPENLRKGEGPSHIFHQIDRGAIAAAFPGLRMFPSTESGKQNGARREASKAHEEKRGGGRGRTFILWRISLPAMAPGTGGGGSGSVYTSVGRFWMGIAPTQGRAGQSGERWRWRKEEERDTCEREKETRRVDTTRRRYKSAPFICDFIFKRLMVS